MNYIFYAKDFSNSASQFGGKASILAQLASSMPVPDWFVLSPAAFDNSLTDLQRQQIAAGEYSLTDVQPSALVLFQLSQALMHLCPQGELVAVRSSALEEDGVRHSFAGQLDSFLNVAISDVAQKVVAVWRSGFADRLLAYRQDHQLMQLPSPPAVLIQKMVQPEAAGVAFSANPVTGQRGTAVVSAVCGLGEALVSGAQEGRTWEVDRNGEISRGDEAQAAILTDEEIRAVATLARRVEQQLGRPQDIEWAIEAENLYLLQARPITTLKNLSDPDGVLQIWDNSNIAESYGGVTTPLTFSFAQQAYEAVYRQFCRLMGVSEAVIDRQDATFRCMLGLVQGRIYYNLLNWYRVLALLPGFTVNRRFMEQMMGVREDLPIEVLRTIEQASLSAKVQDSLRLASAIVGLLKNYVTLPRQIHRFYQRLNAALADRSASASSEILLTSLRPDELVAHYRQLERQLLTHWDAPLVNDFFAMIFYGVLRKLTARWCDDGNGTLQNDLISGEGGIISAEPAQRIRQMAATIARDTCFVQLLCHGSLPEILREIPRFLAFQIQYDAYLEKFGDRCLEELKLESETLQDNPLLLLRSIGQLAQRQDCLQSGQPSTCRSEAEAKVKDALKANPVKQSIFNWVLQNARARVRDRENLRFERTRVFGRVRRIMVELGKRFYALDILGHPKDIFYLNLDEVLGFVEGTTTCTDLPGLINIRRAEFRRYSAMSAPHDRFSTRGAVHPLSPILSFSVAGSPAHLQGTGCCPGVVRAPVQIVTNPHTVQIQPGHILVAERTDPGWILLFPAAAGLLVERGSVLSHAAIVAREMSIPAIVSISGITRLLKDGDWVEMNGSTGSIQRIESSVSQVENFSCPVK
ncbi:phosphoenolpyruvate synthase [Phormidium tenue FACHB-886]|nr:phosphoenolpyruvate synthase [Phormidium tenue FACHB-886]